MQEQIGVVGFHSPDASTAEPPKPKAGSVDKHVRKITFDTHTVLAGARFALLMSWRQR